MKIGVVRFGSYDWIRTFSAPRFDHIDTKQRASLVDIVFGLKDSEPVHSKNCTIVNR